MIDFLFLGSVNVPMYFGNQTTKHIIFPYISHLCYDVSVSLSVTKCIGAL